MAEAGDLSDSSCDSDDDELGCGTMLDGVQRRLGDAGEEPLHMTKEELEAAIKRGEKLFFVFYNGRKLNYLDSHRERREECRSSFLRTIGREKAKPRMSMALSRKVDAARKSKFGILFLDEMPSELTEDLKLSEKVRDVALIKTLKAPTHFALAVRRAGEGEGNPFVHCSRKADIAFDYADYPKTTEESSLTPQYREVEDPDGKSRRRKPKHRTVGMVEVVVIAAEDYVCMATADIEALREEGKVGKRCAVERENEEVIFHTWIAPEHIAGCIPLVYPSFHKPYDDKYRTRYGLSGPEYKHKGKLPQGKEFNSKSAHRVKLKKHLARQAERMAAAFIREKGGRAVTTRRR